MHLQSATAFSYLISLRTCKDRRHTAEQAFSGKTSLLYSVAFQWVTTMDLFKPGLDKTYRCDGLRTEYAQICSGITSLSVYLLILRYDTTYSWCSIINLLVQISPSTHHRIRYLDIRPWHPHGDQGFLRAISRLNSTKSRWSRHMEYHKFRAVWAARLQLSWCRNMEWLSMLQQTMGCWIDYRGKTHTL